jgi:phage terminase large subunit GpA-like protein
VFVNTVLGQGWREEADETNEDELASRAEPISLEAIPEAVLMLTVGCDVQQDRLEVTTAGWAKDGTCFILDHRAIWGSPDDNEIWHELDEHLNRRFDHPRGGQPLRIDAACIDAGSGSHYDVVCRFAQARLSRRVFAIKGIGGQGRPSIIRSRSKTRVLHIVGVDSLKGNILAKLAQQRAFRFSDQLPEHYWSEVTAERRVVRYTRGRPTIRLRSCPAVKATRSMRWSMPMRLRLHSRGSISTSARRSLRVRLRLNRKPHASGAQNGWKRGGSSFAVSKGICSYLENARCYRCLRRPFADPQKHK